VESDGKTVGVAHTQGLSAGSITDIKKGDKP